MTATTKPCTRCKTTKPVAAFKPDPRLKSGLSSWCRDCFTAYDKARAEKRRKSTTIGRPPKLMVDGRFTCSTCKKPKPPADFAKDAGTPSGLRSRCKACDSAGTKTYRLANRERRIASTKAWKLANRDRNRALKKASDVRCRPRIRAGYKRWLGARTTNLVGARLRTRLANALRQHLSQVRRGGKPVSWPSAVRDLGCTLPQLVAYLERRFKPGMSWDNYGDWHIDHVRPLASFDLNDSVQVLEACHFTNLQPLWAAENLSKGATAPP